MKPLRQIIGWIIISLVFMIVANWPWLIEFVLDMMDEDREYVVLRK